MRVLLLSAAFFLLVACGDDNSDVTSPAAESTAEGGRGNGYDRTITVQETQSIDGVDLTLQGIGIGSPDELLAGSEFVIGGDDVLAARSLIVVFFSVSNRSSSTQTIHTPIGTTALVNDEQIDADWFTSDTESRILAGAVVDMYAVFPSQRYTSAEVRMVRFAVEKEFSFEGDKVFDFTIFIPQQ